tara:strand:- start:638 stop:1582 length:945 start_codon:yes stop_codon:yes gene_type:complete
VIVYFNRPTKREAWGGGSHFITSFHDFLKEKGHTVVFDLVPNIGVIFMFDPRPSHDGAGANEIYRYKIFNPSAKIVQRINDTDIARPMDRPWRVQTLLNANQIADHTVFISNWVKDHYIQNGFDSNNPNTVIINGCDSRWYYPNKENTLNEKNIKLITHHWSDNFMKGFDIYNFLDRFVESHSNISFTYMGRYNKDYSPLNTKIIPPTYGLEVGNILRQHDIYVTAARFEACGMHHIEAAASGLPVLYHVDGGAVPEVCKNHGFEFSDQLSFVNALDSAIENYDVIRKNIDHEYLSSERCLGSYEEIVKGFKTQ